jgi:hypothetical protein
LDQDKLKKEVQEEVSKIQRGKKLENPFEAFDIFLEALMNVIAKYLPNSPIK